MLQIKIQVEKVFGEEFEEGPQMKRRYLFISEKAIQIDIDIKNTFGESV